MVLAGCSTNNGGNAETTPGASASAAPMEMTELTVSTTSATFGLKEDVAVYATGIEMGFYEEEGITLDMVSSDGSSAAIQAVAAGSAAISTPDAGSILGSVESGLPIKGIGGLVQNWPWRVAVPAGSTITSGADLKGKKIGVISLASGSAPYARAFVEGNDLDAETDVELLPVGLGAQAAGALANGDVDALALFTTAYVSIEQSGIEFDYIDNPSSMDGLRSLTFIASDKALEADKELYERFLRASYKSLVFSASNVEAAVKMGYAQYPQLTQAEDINLDIETLQDWINIATPTGNTDLGSVTDWGEIPASDWEATQAFSVSADQISAPLDLDTVWDPSLLTAANDFDGAAVVKQAEEYTEK